MEVSSDSDDSAFLFSVTLPKRKVGCDNGNKLKKLRLSCEDKNTLVNVKETEKETGSRNDIDSSDVNNKLKLEALSSDETIAGKNDDKLTTQVEEFSCPLCRKISHTETLYFSHMKQCAKKSKMSAKELLEALQLHKKHLKERFSAGIPNIVTKKKKIQVQDENGDSAYQLAMGLALSKSLEDTVASKENDNTSANININRSNKTTLEKFGFTSLGKSHTTAGKKTKNSKVINSVLRKRTNEEREILLTEKASVVLLINDDTMIAEAKESLRMYHSQHIEQNRNKDSQLWKLGESNEEEIKWYVDDLKNLILEEDIKVEEKVDNQNVVHEESNIDEEILKLNLPRNAIYEDWRRLINNKHLSDLTLHTKDGGTVYVHSVVLYARHDKMLDLDLRTIFYKFDNCIVLKLLQYLYCGTLDGLARGEVDNLYDLTQTLGYEELLGVLSTLKEALQGSSSKSNGSAVGHSSQKKDISTPEIDNLSECTNSTSSDAGASWSVLSSRKEHDDELCRDRVEEPIIEEKTWRPHSPDAIQNGGSCRKWNTEEAQSETDMFEEAEILNKSMNENIETNQMEKNDPECIEISSGSVKSDTTCVENMAGESENILPEMDYEIPYFDPYEHFSSDIPDTGTFPGSEEPNHSQSLMIGEISPVKSTTPKRISFLDNASPCVTAPGCSSTPNNEIPSTSACPDITKERSERRVKRKYSTPCSKINRRSGRPSRLFGSRKKCRERKSRIGPDEQDSEKVACVLTESIIRELDQSIGTTEWKTPPGEEPNYIEVTPAVPGEEYVDDVSPLPDYSVMGASSIKKHLTKYGLKKSLSKNKAKKILRHIYEELHPVLNTKNGKIVKYIEKDKSKKGKVKKVAAKARKGKRSTTGEKTSTPRRKTKKRTEVEWSQPETPTKNKRTCTSNSPKLASPKIPVEEDRQSCTSTDSYDGASGSNTLSDGSCFEVEDQLSQNNYTSATDAPTAVYDFIHNNPDIHRQILMYEPIWLEELQRKLYEKYNKKFKLIDLMDCLDKECVTFRCESQRRTNKRRK